MLVCCWSPKGGSGTSVFAAACALDAGAASGGARLADLDGDQPPILGLAADPATGLARVVAVGVEAPVDALERFAVARGAALTLLPAGAADLARRSPRPAPRSVSRCASTPAPTIVDVGVPTAPALEALLEVADASIVVLRACYLALRRAVRMPATAGATGVVLVEESGRALGARDVADVLGVPVLATVSVRSSVARAIDAGVFPVRMPDALAEAGAGVADASRLLRRRRRARPLSVTRVERAESQRRSR